MDQRLSRWVDADGQIWQICQICIEWTRYQDLAIDPTDGLRWDVCANCDVTEFNRSANALIRRLMPKIPVEYQTGFEGMIDGGEYAMATEDLAALVADHRIELSPVETERLGSLMRNEENNGHG